MPFQKKISEADEQKICDDYQNTETTCFELATQFNFTAGGIDKILLLNKIPGRNKSDATRIGVVHLRKIQSNEDEQRVILDYQSGMTLIQIANKFGTSTIPIRKILKQNNIPFRTNSESHKKHHCNENFFETIDSEAKAYFLGFILADGSIGDYGTAAKKLRITIHNQDREILVKLLQCLDSDHKINDKPSHCSLEIRNNKLCSDLAKYDIVPRKTFIAKWVDLENTELQWHLVRGLNDGDGGFYSQDSEGGCHSLDITGTMDVLSGCQEFLISECNVNRTKISPRNKDKTIFRMRYNGNNQMSKIIPKMYANATIFLTRKKKKIDHYLKGN